MKKFKLGLLLACVTSSCFAAVPYPFGWYLEGNVGISRTNDADYGSGVKYSNTNSYAWNIAVGYKFIPFIAAEIGYTQYGKTDIKFNNTTIGNANAQKSLDFALKGILPVYDSGFEFFAKIGAAKASTHVKVDNATIVQTNQLNVDTGSHSSTGAYYALGADYTFMPNLSVNLQWARASVSSRVGNLDLYSIGLNWLFN